MEYPIICNNRVVGIANVERQGLFENVCCQCQGLSDEVHRVYMKFCDKTLLVGVLLPTDNAYALSKRIPTRHLGSGSPQFYTVKKDQTETGERILLQPGQPVAHLDRLRVGKLLLLGEAAYFCVNERRRMQLPDPSIQSCRQSVSAPAHR